MTLNARGDEAPDFLTVEEAAEVLRIGRTAAYQLAREFLATAGAVGLPVIRYGRQFRVPRCRLEEQLGGPLTWPPSPPRKQPSRRSTPSRRPMRQLSFAVES
jgi:excisionase family DNA binding protein